jgi:cell division protein FtsQ
MVGASSGLFKAAEVEVRGLSQVDRDGLLSRAGLNPAPNLLALDLNELASRLISEPWLKHVRLERRLPNRLLVEVVERRPVAVVTSSGKGGPATVLVDEEGMVLMAASDEDRRRYPIVRGASRPTPSLGSRFSDPAVASGLAVLQATKDLPLVGRKSLAVIECSYPGRIILRGRKSHAVVAVRGGDLERKFARLKTLAKELKRRHGSIQYIDLSFERRVIIKGVDKDA